MLALHVWRNKNTKLGLRDAKTTRSNSKVTFHVTDNNSIRFAGMGIDAIFKTLQEVFTISQEKKCKSLHLEDTTCDSCKKWVLCPRECSQCTKKLILYGCDQYDEAIAPWRREWSWHSFKIILISRLQILELLDRCKEHKQ